MKDKQALDIVAAILANGILAARDKPSPKEATKLFFDVRDELVKEMADSERDHLPIYISQRWPRRRR